LLHNRKSFVSCSYYEFKEGIKVVSGAVVGGIVKKQLQPIKDDLEYIKKQVDGIRDRIDGLTARIEAIEKALRTAKVA